MRELIARWTEAERTHNVTRDLLGQALNEQVGAEDIYVWVVDLSDDWLVYELSGPGTDEAGLYRVSYTFEDGDKVSFGTREKVHVTYTPATQMTEAGDSISGRVLESKGQDASGGRIFRVRLISYGDSRNGRRYTESVMRRARSLYEGAKAYDHHRTQEELVTSTIEGLVGTYRNVEAGPQGLDADLCLLPSATHTAEALEASLAAQRDGLAPVVGVSHDVIARYRPVSIAGRQFQEATEILKVNSADVVADPAAGGRATRMVAGGLGDPNSQEGTMTLKQLLELLREASAEKRSELLKEHGTVIEEAGITAEQALAIVTAPAADNGGAGTPAPDAGTPGASASGDAGGQPTPTPAAVGATEATYGRESIMGRTIVQTAVRNAQLDERLVESVMRALPEQFHEADVSRQIEALTTLRADLERAGLVPTVPHISMGTEDRDRKVEAVEAMLAGDYKKGYVSMKEAFLDVTGFDARQAFARDSEDLNRVILRESAGALPYDSARRSTESVETSTWAEVLGDSIHRRMVAEYALQQLSAWTKIVSSKVPVMDFRDQRITRVGGYGTLPIVGQGAPYQALATPTDEEVKYALQKRGGTEDLTIEAIANDDMRAVQRIPKALGRAGAQTIFRFVFDLLASNPAIYDNVALFAAGHSNTDAASALAQATLSTGRRKMRKQTAYGDDKELLGEVVVPKYLLVPSDLEETAWQLCNSAVEISANRDATVPNIHQNLEPVVIDYWSDTNDWFLVADPALCPTIEIGFYRGQEEPELFVQSDPTVGSVFTADKITYKIRHIYSGAVLDYRGFYRGQG